MPPRLINERFGALVVINTAPGVRRKGARCLVLCNCGRLAAVWPFRLMVGLARSCGCRAVVKPRKSRRNGSRRRRPEYVAWWDMRRRCYDPTRRDFRNYGARGITVCAEWRSSFAAFFAHVGPRPSPKHSIDRIDNDGNYEPGNVRWATVSQQQRNRRDNRRITVGNTAATLAEWCERNGLSVHTVAARLRLGWPADVAVTKLPKRTKELAT